MNNLSNSELRIVWGVLQNCWGYPMSKDNSILLGFDSELCNQLKHKISPIGKVTYSPDVSEKKIILKSFEVFLSEMSDERESIPLTDHTKTEIQGLYEKLKKLYIKDT